MCAQTLQLVAPSKWYNFGMLRLKEVIGRHVSLALALSTPVMLDTMQGTK
jgi:hypothetical protein